MHYKHDCNRCVSLGDHTEGGEVFDLYYCPARKTGSGEIPAEVIARFGDNGPDYHSMFTSTLRQISGLRVSGLPARDSHPLCEALRRFDGR